MQHCFICNHLPPYTRNAFAFLLEDASHLAPLSLEQVCSCAPCSLYERAGAERSSQRPSAISWCLPPCSLCLQESQVSEKHQHPPSAFSHRVFTLVKVYWTTVDLKAAFRMSEDEEKVKLRRIEPAIQKFIKVAIPTDLERLRKHQINIEKYQRCRLWDRLHEEHINAGRTVQQLRANMREMEKLCLRVRQEDIPLLQRMINPIKEEASLAIKDFLQLHSESAEELKRQLKGQEDASLTRSATLGQEVKDGSQSLIQIYSRLPEIPQEENAAESWESLEGDLVELSQLVTEFSLLVCAQQEKIDRIEDHVNTAAANVEEGTKNLGKAAKYKLAALPVAGAVIGGVVGGPIGLLAGFKVAGIAAALGGGILGFTGGKLIQRKKQKMIEQVSSSCPELSHQSAKKSS
ncbi:syntaxin-17 isoform X2 [Onychostruthus taczanowskii]|uniref:syntaxin-17 isoform X2 n=1 Tax=Onychostruthus taczanowskii TaxID=356909 RepID=UPI001B80908C|nr:syntaxin-17 isoform X2 [Onychostruthus taczanowskii]